MFSASSWNQPSDLPITVGNKLQRVFEKAEPLQSIRDGCEGAFMIIEMDESEVSNQLCMERKMISSYLLFLVTVAPMSSECLWIHEGTEFHKRVRRHLQHIARDNTCPVHAVMKYYFDLKLLQNQMVCQSCFIMHDSAWHTVVL